MADESDMRNELADLQTRADQIADEVQLQTRIHTCVHLVEHVSDASHYIYGTLFPSGHKI